MLRNPGLRKSVEQPVLDLNFAASQIGSNGAPDSRIDFSRGSNAYFVDSDGLVKKSPHNLAAQSEDLGNGWAFFNASASLNTAISPTGEMTADKVVTDNSATLSTTTKQVTTDDSVDVAVSVYVKAAGQTVINIQFYNKANTFHGSGDYDLTTGTRINNPSAGTQSSIENVGNDWYRITFTGLNMATGGTTPSFRVVCNQTGDGVKGFLVWGAQLSQHSTLPVGNPYVKTEGSAVYAARLDHDPTWLMSAAQEQNLLKYSEAIDDSYWNKIRTTVTANAIEAPDGTVTAELLAEDSSANQTHVVRQNTVTDIPQTAGKSYVFSGYVKAGGRNRVRIRFEHAAHQADLLLNDGTFFNNGFDSVTFTDVGNGWFRFVVVETADSREPLVQIMLVNDSGQSTYTGDGSSGVYVWGLQLEIGTASDTYHRTEGQIYLGPGATPKGLLVEEARTNLAPSSHEFTANTGVSRTGTNHFAPNAVNEGDAFTIDSTSGVSHQIGMNGLIGGAITIGTVHTVSFFAKLLNGTPNIGVRGFGKGGQNQHPIFNLSNGTVANVGSAWESGTKIEDFGNGWFRCSCVVNPSNQFAPIIHMLESGDTIGSLVFTGNGTDKIALWGGQLEVGSFVTSHIPTSGSTATRNADVATMGPTVAPDKLGPELVTNGTFDDGTNGWSNFSTRSNLSVSSGQLVVDVTDATKGFVAKTLANIPVVSGRRYRVSADLAVNSGSGVSIHIPNGVSPFQLIANTATVTSGTLTTATVDFTCPSGVTEISFMIQNDTPRATTDEYVIDNASIKEILPGTELVTNGTFDTDVSNWTAFTSTLSHQSGKLRVTSTGGDYPMAIQTLTTVIGRRYRLTADVIVGNTPLGAVVQVNAETGQSFTASGGLITSNSTVTIDFTANITNVNILLHGHTGTSAGQYQEFDNVSVRELYPFEQYNPSEGTLFVEATQIGEGSTFASVAAIVQEGSHDSDLINIYRFASTDRINFQVKTGGVNQASLGSIEARALGTAYKFAGSYLENSISVSLDGIEISDDTSATLPAVDQLLFYGDVNFQSNEHSGYIKRFRYYKRKLDKVTLQSLTSD